MTTSDIIYVSAIALLFAAVLWLIRSRERKDRELRRLKALVKRSHMSIERQRLARHDQQDRYQAEYRQLISEYFVMKEVLTKVAPYCREWIDSPERMETWLMMLIKPKAHRKGQIIKMQ